ncbi:expressed unknown protein [Seminavis robusta]|uniref:Uncharacterized protein n=1 Tax=Seminavis robusta TaxID=568900 RepID=A0A9N8H917_9STRA|nr:expressed unknown protein [Seminavis robusta]|eukprot:Sro189_g081550.1 n/a (699) ;mRNA; r:59962-62264
MGKPPRHRTVLHAAAASAASKASGSRKQRQVSSNNSTGSAPSSVMCVPAPLTRELSDLSGSYMNGNTAPRGFNGGRASVCSNEHEQAQGFWRQAYILSSPCPKETPPAPAVTTTTTTTTTAATTTAAAATQQQSQALIVVERNGVIELVKKSDSGSSTGGDDQHDHEHQQQQLNRTNSFGARNGAAHNQSNNKLHTASRGAELSNEDLLFLSHTSPTSLLLSVDNNSKDDESSRIPILILLLDPGRKQYEIMQLWVDPLADLARDVLYALQRKLSDRWRQDYDGLFQLRGDKFCQLVHILSIAKYDVRPRELWVAKPWSMAAKAATDIARDCIRQLRAGGLLDLYPNSQPGKSRIKNFLRKGSKEGRTSPVFENDIPLTLSEEALKRLHIPNGVMKHHHACQFLSFQVPSIPSRVPVHPQRGNSQNGSRGFLGSLLGTSQSFDDVSSQLSNPSDVMLLPSNTDLIRVTSSFSTSSPATSPSRRQRQPHGGYTPPFASQQYNNFDSNWKPSGPLEVVGEFIVANNDNGRDTTLQRQVGQQPDTNASTILADLNRTNPKDLSEPKQFEDEIAHSKKQRCSIWNYLSPLNCVKRRANGKGEDGYSSSWGGDGSRSSGSKNNRIRRSNSNDANGRAETPTSKGSHDDEQSFRFDPGWKEDNSIISDSAPLLSSLRNTSNFRQAPEQPKHQKANSHSRGSIAR